jgi:hypothetical protein
MQMYFEGIHEQAQYRMDGTVPDFDTYVEMRRETSGCRPVFDLIEYSLDMELPDAVVEHPVIVALNDGANDLVTWSNVSARLVATPISICKWLTKSAHRIYSHTMSNKLGPIPIT